MATLYVVTHTCYIVQINYYYNMLCLCTGCLQGYVFDNGPLCPDTTLNYSYQLFEALDYLHQRLKVIHCDIKREK